jgi:spore germination cell wall hydrolase CwlJ-like protein
MTNEKKTTDIINSIFCILAVLTLSLYYGVTDSKASNQLPTETQIMSELQNKQVQMIPADQSSGEIASEEKIHKEPATNVAETAINENKPLQKEPAESDVKVVSSTPAQEAVPDYICANANRGGAANRKETDVLIRLINAEAYGLSYKAKVAVGQVVMNRWVGPHYGDDLLAIMTAPHQFTPIYDGSAYKKEIEPDSIKAAYAVLSGNGVNELTSDTYYFVNPDFTTDKTIENKMQFVCEIEGMHFYRPPAN